MKRWLLRISLLLLLGVVTTVGVAWGTALCVSPFATVFKGANGSAGGTVSDVELHETRVSTLVVYAHYPAPNRDSSLDRVYELLPKWYHPNESPAFSSGQSLLDIRFLEQRGFPMRSLFHERLRSTVNGFDVESLAGGAQTAISPWDHASLKLPRTLPLRPIALGFIIDTAFYAVIWFTLLFSLSRFSRRRRRRIRERKGMCIKCGYDLKGAFENGCSECGWNRVS